MKGWIGLAATAALLLANPAWTGAAGQAAKRTAAPDDSRQAAQLAASARAALARGDAPAAIGYAEAAAAALPNDAANRILLGRAYLTAGRFRSAEMAFGDALTLDPAAGAAVSRALAQIALGRGEAALASLDQAKDKASEADIGLALALLGRADEARERLTHAARAAGADARSRLNLAFAYALEGRWNEAAAIAAQDIPADRLGDRLRRWAMIAQLKGDPAMQVGALLGVLPAVDQGQPAALALAAPQPAREDPPLIADAAAPPSAPPFVMLAPPVVVPSPVAVAVVRPSEDGPRAPVRPGPAPADPRIQVARLDPAPKQRSQAESSRAAPVNGGPPVSPVPAGSAPQRAVQIAGGGKWMVQLGAFFSLKRSEAAWTRLSTKAAFLSDYPPSASALRRSNGRLYRLSVGGFATRADAVRLCVRIKANGGACFVRAASGERPMQWVLGGRSVQPA